MYNFTVPMALMDFVPVIFFGITAVLLLRDLGNKQWECLCKPGRKMQVGNEVIFGNGELTATVTEVKEDGKK